MGFLAWVGLIAIIGCVAAPILYLIWAISWGFGRGA